MSVKDYELFFENFSLWNWISFTGGEPFLRKDLVDIVSAAYERCDGLHTVSIPTNGFLTDKIVHDVQEILSMKIPSFYTSVSLDGLREIHDANRGIDGSFEHAISTFNSLRKLSNRRFKVHFEYLISKYNQGKLTELISALNLSPNDFVISIAQKSFFYDNMALDIEPDRNTLLQDVNWFVSNLKIRSIHDLAQFTFLKHVSEFDPIPCVAGKSSFYVDPYGKMFPCLLKPNQLGTVKDNGLAPFKANPGCRCFTPCESYFAILSHVPKSLLRVTVS